MKKKIKSVKSVMDKNNSKKPVVSKEFKELEIIANYYHIPEENLNSPAIIHKMMETLELYLKVIQQIIQPEEFHSLYECSSFTEDEKEKMFEMYKTIIILHRDLFKLIILNNEKESISKIRNMHQELLKFNDPMIKIVEKMQDSWRNLNSDKKNKSVHYFG